MVDRVYRSAWPGLRRALRVLKTEFSKIDVRTDWVRLRIDPLLLHLGVLEALVRSWEASPLRRGVPMLHSDLVYFRENIRGLQQVLASEKRWSQRQRNLP